jgi:hypothetical protein
MNRPDFSVVATVRPAFRPLGWIAEVTDPASPLAGATVCARTPERARRALAAQVALALVDDRDAPLPDAVTVDVLTWHSSTYGVPIPPW